MIILQNTTVHPEIPAIHPRAVRYKYIYAFICPLTHDNTTTDARA